jgi:hypothetical protein
MPRLARKIGPGCAITTAAFVVAVVAVVLLLLAKLFLPNNPVVAAVDLEDGIAAVESWLTGSQWLFEWRVWLNDHPESLWAGVLLLFAATLVGSIGSLRLRRHLRRRARRRSGLCPACGYDRRAQHAGDPCPECGTPS